MKDEKYFLIRFRAEYYCQGYEYAWFTKLVKAPSITAAIEKLRTIEYTDFEKGTAKDFVNETIE